MQTTTFKLIEGSYNYAKYDNFHDKPNHTIHRIIGSQIPIEKHSNDYFNRYLYAAEEYVKEEIKLYDAGTTVTTKLVLHEGGLVKCKAFVDSGSSISLMPHSTLQQILRKGCIRGTASKIPKRNIKVLGGGKVTNQA